MRRRYIRRRSRWRDWAASAMKFRAPPSALVAGPKRFRVEVRAHKGPASRRCCAVPCRRGRAPRRAHFRLRWPNDSQTPPIPRSRTTHFYATHSSPPEAITQIPGLWAGTRRYAKPIERPVRCRPRICGARSTLRNQLKVVLATRVTVQVFPNASHARFLHNRGSLDQLLLLRGTHEASDPVHGHTKPFPDVPTRQYGPELGHFFDRDLLKVSSDCDALYVHAGFCGSAVMSHRAGRHGKQG